MKRLVMRLLNFLARFRPYRTEWVEDLPEKPRARTVYIVGGRSHPYEAVFACPRGCGEFLRVDVAPQHRKSWRVSEHKGGAISLSPSVWLTTECRCHFWLQNGRIVWCELPAFGAANRKRRARKQRGG